MIKQIANARQIPPPSFDESGYGSTGSPTDCNHDGLAEIRAIAEPDRRNAKNGKSGIAPKASRQSKTDTRGFRWQVRVWLDAAKPDQLDLGRWIHELKCKRTFAPILRNALSLYRELMIGEVGMLYQLFHTAPKPLPPPAPSAENEELKKRIGILEGQVAILEQVIISTRLPTAIDNAVKMASVPRPTIAMLPVTPPPVAVEVDTSSSFLDMF